MATSSFQASTPSSIREPRKLCLQLSLNRLAPNLMFVDRPGLGQDILTGLLKTKLADCRQRGQIRTCDAKALILVATWSCISWMHIETRAIPVGQKLWSLNFTLMTPKAPQSKEDTLDILVTYYHAKRKANDGYRHCQLIDKP